MKQYKDYLSKTLTEGYSCRQARDNMPKTFVLPTQHLTFPFKDGFPILTGKKMPFYSILGELICFMQGKTDVRDFAKMGCNVWNANAYKWNIVDRGINISFEEYVTWNEIWKDIPTHADQYQASSEGRIRSKDKVVDSGRGSYVRPGTLLKPAPDPKGYLKLNLITDGVAKTFAVHKLVAETFFNIKLDGYDLTVDHINNIRNNNAIYNLQIINQHDNLIKNHKRNNGGLNSIDKVKGVHLLPTGKFRAVISIDGKPVHLGCFDTEEEASNIYNLTVSKVSNHEYIRNSLYDLGRIYAAQWRNWNNDTDQLENLIENIINKSSSRYHVMTAWNPAELDNTSQPNCHVYYQATVVPGDSASMNELNTLRNVFDYDTNLASKYYIKNDNILIGHLTQRSCDEFLGVPFNITSYSLFTILLGILTKTLPIQLDWVGVNNHIYNNHVDQCNEYLKRPQFELPKLHIEIDRINTLDKIMQIKTLAELKEIFWLVDYKHGDKIVAPLSVGL